MPVTFQEPSPSAAPEQPFTLAQMSPPPRRRRAGLIIGLAVGALGLVATTVITTIAVVDRGTTGARQPLAQSSAPAAPIAGSPSPAVTASHATPTGPHKLGEQVIEEDGAAASTVFAFRQPVARSAPQPEQEGYEWAAADVEVCARVDDIHVTRLPWHLVYADHTTIAASSTGYQQFPEPAYPWGDKDLPKDRCVRGWITFAAPADKRPATVEYNPTGVLTEWAISKP